MPPKGSNFRVRRSLPTGSAGGAGHDCTLPASSLPATTDRKLQADLMRPRAAVMAAGPEGSATRRRSSALPPLSAEPCQENAGQNTGGKEAGGPPMSTLVPSGISPSPPPRRESQEVPQPQQQPLGQPSPPQEPSQPTRSFLRPMVKLTFASRPPPPAPAPAPAEAEAEAEAEAPVAIRSPSVAPQSRTARAADLSPTRREDLHGLSGARAAASPPLSTTRTAFLRGVALLNAALGVNPEEPPHHHPPLLPRDTHRTPGTRPWPPAAMVVGSGGATTTAAASEPLTFQAMVPLEDPLYGSSGSSSSSSNNHHYSNNSSSTQGGSAPRQCVLRTVPLLPLWVVTDGSAILLVDCNGTHKHRNHASVLPSTGGTGAMGQGHMDHGSNPPATAAAPALVWFAGVRAGGGEKKGRAPLPTLFPGATRACDGSLRVAVAACSAALPTRTPPGGLPLPTPSDGLRRCTLAYGREPLLLFCPPSSPLAEVALTDLSQAFLPAWLESVYAHGVPLRGLWVEKGQGAPLWQRGEGREALGHVTLPQVVVDALTAGYRMDSSSPARRKVAGSGEAVRPAKEGEGALYTSTLRSTGPLAGTTGDGGRARCCLTVTVLTPRGPLLLRRPSCEHEPREQPPSSRAAPPLQQQEQRISTGRDVRAALVASHLFRTLGLEEGGFDLVYAPGTPPLQDSDWLDAKGATLRLVRHASAAAAGVSAT